MKLDTTEKIKTEYINHLLRNGKNPVSVLQFSEQIKISESDFFERFNSFKSIEKDVWKSFITDTVDVLNNDPEYPNYSAREKTLAFFYTLLEVVKQNRSLVLFRLEGFVGKMTIPFFMSDFFKEFTNHMNEILAEAVENQEIVTRPIVGDQYVQLYKLIIGYILKVWISDSSKDYQTTDAAVEKSINLTFEMLQKGPIDSIIDFVKFAYQNRAF